MRQVRHIFFKDVRYLRLEIGLFLLLCAGFVFTELSFGQQEALFRALLTFGAAFLIARVVHEEPLPGENQFWISRPYRWQSLLGAKLLFILVCINLPLLAARFMILVVAGLPISASLPGLLWSQFLMLVVGCVPIAALAALTAGLVPFIFSAVVVIGVVLTAMQLVVFRTVVIDQVEWVWDILASFVVAAAAAVIICYQYRARFTRVSRTAAIMVVVTTLAVYLFIPWPFAFWVETQMGKRTTGGSSMYVEPLEKLFYLGERRLAAVDLDFPLMVKNVPGMADVEADALWVTLRTPSGRTWTTSSYMLAIPQKLPANSGSAYFNCVVTVPRRLFSGEKEEIMSIHGFLYLTLFGNAKSKTIPIHVRPAEWNQNSSFRTIPSQSKPVNVMDGLQCEGGPINDVDCRSPFRWPVQRLYADFGNSGRSKFTHALSYSPFPAELSFQTLETDGAAGVKEAREVTIIAKEAIDHVRVEFKIPAVKVVRSVDKNFR